ncbi:MAG TPA: TonB-dependent receptor plug domain-containing protein [Opitutaceae bacterium]|nr:TonB-dependent receptor plug domain-containing protein [Opitutaceae bacterium]
MLTISALGLVLSLPLQADTPPASPTPAPAPASDETIVLSPFTVSGDSSTSYGASESTTGTRVATKIADLPFVVNVITSEFLNDFNFFDIGDELGYTSSLSGVDSEGNFALRGFQATFYLWNGFYRLGVVDRVDIDKIEIIKGPNAAIYGQTAPSGLLNIVTKVPTRTPKEDIKFTYGSFNLGRVEGHINTPGTIGKLKVGNLASFSGLDRDFDTTYAFEKTRTFSDSLKLWLTDKSDLTTTFEFTRRLTNSSNATLPFIAETTRDVLAPIALARFSQSGPLNNRVSRELSSIDSIYENRFNDVWSLRLSEYAYKRNANEIDNTKGLFFLPNNVDPNGQVDPSIGISTKPIRSILDEDGGASQADLLAHYFLFHHTVENRTLFTLDWSQNWRYRRETQLPSNLNNLPSTVSVGNPVYVTEPTQDLFTVVTRNDKVRWDTYGIFGREQATMFNGRLILYTGARHDQVKYNLGFGNQFSVTSPFGVKTFGQVQHFTNSAWTLAGGANYKLIKDKLALYGNYSQSFEPSAQVAKLGDPPLGNTRASGVDYGVKGSFFSNKLQFTVGGYYIIEHGVKATVFDVATGLNEVEPVGSQSSKGVEADWTYDLTNSLSLLGGYGYVNARIFNDGTNILADGKRPPNIPVDNGSFAIKYKFSGTALKGLSIHTGVIYVGQSYPETGSNNAPEVRLTLPSYYTVEIGLDYNWVTEWHGTKFTHSVGLSSTNALNRDYVDTKGTAGTSRGIFVSYTLSH